MERLLHIDRNRGGQGSIYYRSVLDGYILSMARGKFVHQYKWRRKNAAVLNMSLPKFYQGEDGKSRSMSILPLTN